MQMRNKLGRLQPFGRALLVLLLVLSLVYIGWVVQTTFLTPGPGTPVEKSSGFAINMLQTVLPTWLGIAVLYFTWRPKKSGPPK